MSLVSSWILVWIDSMYWEIFESISSSFSDFFKRIWRRFESNVGRSFGNLISSFEDESDSDKETTKKKSFLSFYSVNKHEVIFFRE